SIKWLPDDQVLSTVSDDGHELIYRLLTSSVVYTGEGPLVNSGKYDGLEGRAATNAIIEDLSRQGQAKHTVKYKLRDWVFSRQHYWGEPIPVVHCSKCGVVAVPENQLPVELPAVEHYQPTDTGESPLAAMTDWVNTTCPQCDGPARRETDTMPNWAGSSWYYLRYIDPDNDQAFAGADKLKYWLPVDLYNGGMEHTTLHLLYSRFWHKFMYDQKLVPTPEPYAQRRSHEMILGPDNQKMSKSRGNVINPDAIVGSYGADVLRLYEMFMGPFDETTSWSDERLAGVYRFVNRVWGLAQKLMDSQTSNVTHSTSSGQERQASGTAGAVEAAIDRMTHKTLKKVHEDIAAMRFNTMVSALMEYVNFLHQPDAQQAVTGNSQLAERTVRHLVLMLAPAAPHLAEELWSQLGEAESVHVAAWPQYDPELIKEDLVEIILQVNGKLRGTMTMPVAADEQQLEETAKTQEAIQRYLDGKKIVKTIVVPRKLVNFVVR
ncbi:MAG TPA: class I tRNA ligase family protein, partial [Candidatus Saccharimonadales bacterium]|nr:class I tRNA ligase family protein [Candidatus Saccharimonadales bacterium]